MRIRLYASLVAFALGTACFCGTSQAAEVALRNPYENVKWQTFARYRADLHVHTVQSDGCHLPDEVVRAFHNAGFSILSITDHDIVSPNLCKTRDAATPAQIDYGLFADRPTPYPNPRPANFPANATWPWSNFGAPSPEELGMLGIEGAELTSTYHVNSFFNDYGVPPPYTKASPDVLNEELLQVANRGGLAVLNHPDTRQPPELNRCRFPDQSEG